MSATTSTHRYPTRISVRVPAAVACALEEAASRELTSPSEYTRRALIRAIKADGVALTARAPKTEARA